MTRCCGCGQLCEDCLCDSGGGYPSSYRSAGWQERKMAFDTARDYFEDIKRYREQLAALQEANRNLQAENDELKSLLSSGGTFVSVRQAQEIPLPPFPLSPRQSRSGNAKKNENC